MFLDQLCDRFGIWPFELNASNTLDSERFDHDHACSFLLFFCLKVLKNVSIHLLQENAPLTEYSLLDVLHRFTILAIDSNVRRRQFFEFSENPFCEGCHRDVTYLRVNSG